MDNMGALERLRAWDRCYPGNVNIEVMADEAADRIEALEAENAALREAAERLLVMQGDIMADVISAHSIKIGWTEWRAEADRDFRSALRRAFERLRAALARQTEGEE